MKKIKYFLMVFSAILTLFSVGFGLGVLFVEVIIWFINLFPEKYEDFVFFVEIVVRTLIILKENE